MSFEALAVPPTPVDTVIEARGVGKCYHIYEKPQDRLKQMLWRVRDQRVRRRIQRRDRVGLRQLLTPAVARGSGT